MPVGIKSSGGGTTTLVAASSATNYTATLPANSGTVVTTGSTGQVIPSAALPVGTILQVTQATTTSSSTTSSGSFVTTSFSASITPKSATSKVLITVNGNIDTSVSGLQGVFNVYRNSTPLSTYGFNMAYSAAGRMQAPLSINYLDSPATTSSTTYTLYFAVSSGSGSLIFNGGSGLGAQTATFTLTEVSA